MTQRIEHRDIDRLLPDDPSRVPVLATVAILFVGLVALGVAFAWAAQGCK